MSDRQTAGNGTNLAPPLRQLNAAKDLPPPEVAENPAPSIDLTQLRAAVDDRLLDLKTALDADWRRSLHLLIIFEQSCVAKWRELPEPRETANEAELDAQLKAAIDVYLALRTRRGYVSKSIHPLIDKGLEAERLKCRLIRQWQLNAICHEDLLDGGFMGEGS